MLAFRRINEDDLLVSGHRSRCRLVRALQLEQYSNRPGARVVCFGGNKNFCGTLTQPRPDAFEMRSNLVNTLLQILCYPPEWILPSNLEKNKKIRKCLHRKLLGYLIMFTLSVVMFHKKEFVVTSFCAKVCWSSCATIEVYSHLEGTNSDLVGARPKMPSPASHAKA